MSHLKQMNARCWAQSFNCQHILLRFKFLTNPQHWPESTSLLQSEQYSIQSFNVLFCEAEHSFLFICIVLFIWNERKHVSFVILSLYGLLCVCVCVCDGAGGGRWEQNNARLVHEGGLLIQTWLHIQQSECCASLGGSRRLERPEKDRRAALAMYIWRFGCSEDGSGENKGKMRYSEWMEAQLTSNKVRDKNVAPFPESYLPIIRSALCTE